MLDIAAEAAPGADNAAPVSDRERPTGRVVRNATVSMIVALLILLLFNSDGLRTYARDLPQSELADQIVLAADHWHDLMSIAGLTEPKALVRELRRKVGAE